ncbi:hypothetical protein RIR_jg13393.t1 [Rhizophagus irregularis DAOM 181602=DAOM 197198]|nr:hypothetical protein RIR_jg13393.t1 [Rhizophagus irregularis DAOM 181602=DAOM 197198]
MLGKSNGTYLYGISYSNEYSKLPETRRAVAISRAILSRKATRIQYRASINPESRTYLKLNKSGHCSKGIRI